MSALLARRARLSMTALEAREVPAAITLDATTRVLTVTGDPGNDFALVRNPVKSVTANGATTQVADATQIEATVSTSTGFRQTLTFAAPAVRSVVFNGKGGSDVFVNNTGLPATRTTTAAGTVSGSVVQGSPGNNDAGDQAALGTFVVGGTGQVTVDYLFCGAGYKGQLGLYSTAGMDQYAPGSVAYIQEAVRRVLSSSAQGARVINHQTEAARFGAATPWEQNWNTGTYAGPKTVGLTAGGRYAAVLVPNGSFEQVAANPAAAGSLRPLFSVPGANPYTVTPQLLGQMGDLTGGGSTFAFEDLRLDGTSDRDYNDMVFQVTGARGTATPIREVTNPSRDFAHTDIGSQLVAYANDKQATDPTTNGGFAAGAFTVGATGRVGVDYLFDSGAFVSQVGVFSLQGMGQFAPGSPEFVKEAARRVLSASTSGNVVVDDYTDGARTAASSDPLLRSYNQGGYLGIRTVTMTPGDQVGFMLIPNGTFWEAFANPAATGFKRPLFSLPAANPNGSHQFARADAAGEVAGFEDTRLDVTGPQASDRDYNDVLMRLYGLTANAATPAVATIAPPVRDWTHTLLGVDLTQNSRQNWS